jgi:LysR family transcriptional activator of nhaA
LALEHELLERHQVRLLGACEGVEEHYYAISTERKVGHPLLRRLLAQ